MSLAAKFIPFADRVLLKKIVPVAKSVGGILLPEDSMPRRNECEVIAVGPGRYTENGSLIPCSVKKGDRVLVPGFGGDQIKINNEDYLVFNDKDILGIFQ
ncbi:Cpn10 [Blastocystis sp. ATCC 50177/Nand II]|uniref:Cpn10 n=1 Tax=Blastocystis sp. subtype 1 (strain ATCC 50177 / NandII) TaxID=478820 RepID=A0A196SH39_BLAHN|nr:Cpn10 [Blastocystis sp. ATCC 50177/Nand II]